MKKNHRLRKKSHGEGIIGTEPQMAKQNLGFYSNLAETNVTDSDHCAPRPLTVSSACMLINSFAKIVLVCTVAM